jgi:PPM family protein phosphatase
MSAVLTLIQPSSARPSDPERSDGRLAHYAVTHCGLVRAQNEDSYCVEQSAAPDGSRRYLLAIADGLGGHDSGEVASRLAIDAVRNEFRFWQGGAPERFAARAVRRANDEVFAATHSRPEWHNMQTTLTVAAIEGDALAIGHVGDCRLYRLRNNSAELLTRDHTMAMELMQLHLISPEQAAEHPGRYQLTRAVGGEPFLRIDTTKEKVASSDTYLLCSDGLWAQVPSDELEQIMREPDLEKSSDRLVQAALASGGPDNITAVMFHIVGSEPQPEPVPSSSFWKALKRHR